MLARSQTINSQIKIPMVRDLTAEIQIDEERKNCTLRDIISLQILMQHF